MPTQTELFPEPPPPPDEPGGDGAVAPVWLQRMSLVVLVLFCVYLGVMVAVLPWWTRVWDENPFFFAHPGLNHFLHLGWVRGVISGVGLLDVWIGISEAVSYRESRESRESRQSREGRPGR